MTDATRPDGTTHERRSYLDRLVPAERAIRDAMLAVEELPADVRLTEAVMLLGQAKDRVGDFIDGIATPQPDDHARLIAAAAPELLEALREAEDALTWYADDGKVLAKGALKTVRAAIAKAESQS